MEDEATSGDGGPGLEGIGGGLGSGLFEDVLMCVDPCSGWSEIGVSGSPVGVELPWRLARGLSARFFWVGPAPTCRRFPKWIVVACLMVGPEQARNDLKT